MSAFDKCAFLFARWKNLALWRNLWSILIFVLGTAFIIFLTGAVLLFLRESWLPGALSTLGTIVNGAATGWVLARRSQAVDEEAEAKTELLAHCGGGAAAASVATESTGGAPLDQRINEAEARLNLFGSFR